MAPRQELQSGFTLVELAIVLLIMGGILTLGLGAINAQITNRAYRTTKAKEEAIKDALVAYLAKYRRLPCPDLDFTLPDGDGDNNRDFPPQPEYCKDVFGILPYRDLDLPRDMALDGWDNFFSYQVLIR